VDLLISSAWRSPSRVRVVAQQFAWMQAIDGDCPALRETSPMSDIDWNAAFVAWPISSPLVSSDTGERASNELSLGEFDGQAGRRVIIAAGWHLRTGHDCVGALEEASTSTCCSLRALNPMLSPASLRFQRGVRSPVFSRRAGSSPGSGWTLFAVRAGGVPNERLVALRAGRTRVVQHLEHEGLLTGR
jgi:hypothetical protein